MHETVKYPLDPTIFWETVGMFAGWDYSFIPYFFPSADARAGYPGALLKLGRSLGAAGFQETTLDADALAPTNYKKRRYTNCVMFAEGVLVGAALRTHGAAFARGWTAEHHKGAMNISTVFPGPPRAYVDAGIAAPIDLKRFVEPERNGVYVIQTAHHVWFIVDCDGEHCLRLEANVGGGPRKEFNEGGFYGGAAFAGVGRVPADCVPWISDRGELTAKVRARGGKDYTWEALRRGILADLAAEASSRYVSMARIGFRTAVDPRHVAFPFEPPGVDGVTAAAAYARNEGLQHGFFPLGGHRSIHTGVHFSPRLGERLVEKRSDGEGDAAAGSELQAVRATLPGTLVAVRLANAANAGPTSAADERRRSAEDLTRGSNGFVLVRHDLQALDAAGEPIAGKRFTLHTLAMHLVSPGWSGAEEPYAAVSWLNTLLRPGQGAAIGVDPSDRATFARRFFTAEPAEDALVRRAGKKARPIKTVGATFVREDSTGFGRHADGVAVTRAPEPRFARARKLLRSTDDHHKVLTLLDMRIPVDRGELLGFAGEVLHWEVFAPVEGGSSQLAGLLAYAAEVLGLAHGFPIIKESESDNLLQPGELKALLATLPPATQARLQRNWLGESGDRPNFNDAELPREFHDPAGLPFTARPPTGVASAATCVGNRHGSCDARNLWYTGTVEVLVHPFKEAGAQGPAAPTWEGDLTFALEFEPRPPGDGEHVYTARVQGGMATAEVAIPALARGVKITARTPGVHIEAVAAPTDGADRQKDIDARRAQLKALLPVRWRHVVVEHCNEWTTEGLTKTLERRLVSPVTAAVEAIAWWGHDEAIVGEPGKSLFGGDVDQLPPAAKLVHNANPISVAWLIEQMIHARRLTVVPCDPDSSAAADPPLFAGWVPIDAPERSFAVGAAEVHALAVAPREDYLDDLQFVATIDGRDYPLGPPGSYGDGVLAVRPAVPLWGDARLKVTRAKSPVAPTKTIGPEKLRFHVPVLAGEPIDPADPHTVELLQPPLAPRKGHPKWCFEVPWTRHRPETIRGWVVLRTRQGDGEFTAIEDLGIPFTATTAGKGRAGASRDGFMTGAGAKLVGPFPWRHWQEAGAGAVATTLVQAVAVLRKQVPFKLRTVAASGEQAVLECEPEKLAKLEGLARRLARVDAVGEDGKELTITVLAGDFLEVDFDPTPALEQVIARAGADAPTEVSFGVLFVLGQAPGAQSLKLDDRLDLAGKLAAPHRCGWASAASVVLQRPSIGEITARRIQVGKKTRLAISAPLAGGELAYWRRAGPGFKIVGLAGAPGRVGDVSSGSVHLTVDVPASALAATITISAMVKNKAVCRGLQIAPDGVALPEPLQSSIEEP